MPSTYQLISSNVLTSSAASVTFSSIPATFTDLVVRLSVRSSRSANNDGILYTLNSDTSAIYSETVLENYGGSASSSRSSAQTGFSLNAINASTSTANTFTSIELYLPNYLSTTSKPISYFGTKENNSSTNNAIDAIADLYRNTTAITSVTFAPVTGPNWLSGSSFYLYGIKNS